MSVDMSLSTDDESSGGVIYTPRPSLGARWEYERTGKRSMFSLSEPNWNEMDVEQCFAPPTYVTLNARIGMVLLSVGLLVLDYVTSNTDDRGLVYWAYLAPWTSLASSCYLVIAVFVTVQRGAYVQQPAAAVLPRDGSPLPDVTPHALLRAMWALYAVATTLGVVVAALSWCSVVVRHSSGSHHRSLGSTPLYGNGVTILLLLDGLLCGTIPLRLKQLVLVESCAAVYFLWMLCLYAMGMGNDVLESGDELFRFNQHPRHTIIAVVVTFVVVIPLAFLLLWTLGHLVKRPLECDSEEGRLRASQMDDALHYTLPTAAQQVDDRPFLGSGITPENPPLRKSNTVEEQLCGLV